MSSGTNARLQLYTPPQQMPNVRSHSERSPVTKLPPPPMPALLNTQVDVVGLVLRDDFVAELHHLVFLARRHRCAS